MSDRIPFMRMTRMGGQAVAQHRIGQDERVPLLGGEAGQFGQAALTVGQFWDRLPSIYDR